ncbi:MAG: DUF192 domain-containing protein [archaeon]
MIVRYNNKKICEAKLCDDIFTRSLGLMFSKPKAAVLKANRESIPASSIHTFFMRFPIDVIWLNKNMEVVDAKNDVKPYKFLIAPKKKAMYTIEIPANGLRIPIRKKLEFSF